MKNNLPEIKISEAFWTDQRRRNLESAASRLKNMPLHPILEELYQYDCISHETLMKFNVGILEVWNKEWICIPYPSGMQLYRREFGKKVIRAVEGSSPKESFFELKDSPQKDQLIIAKSPREAMLLDQLVGDEFNVKGLTTGEIGHLTKAQEQYLRKALKGIDSVYVLLDNDTPKSKSIAMLLALNIGKIHSKSVFHVDISTHSNNTYKDITDAVRAGKDSDFVMELLNSAQNIKSIKNISLPGNEVENKPRQFPDSVYKDLPDKLRDIFRFVDREKNKDVLLMASLPVLASHLDKVYARYGSGEFSPDLYSMIIASAAAGKGYANQARQIGLRLSDFYEEENLKVSSLIDSQNGSTNTNHTPKLKSLFFPANSSSRALYDLLQANSGKGLIFETEIDTMLTALSQDWGNFSDLTRKAFHHETCSLSRKGELLTINNPKLSIFMSGTHDQFRNMFTNTENGLYSRFAFYTFESKPEWISQRPSENTNQLHLYIDELSRWMFQLNRMLNERTKPLEVKLADHCWEKMNDYFEEKVTEFVEEGYPEDLVGNLWRSGIILLKITMILTSIRAYQELGDQLNSKDLVTAEEVDFNNSLRIVDILLSHSFYLFRLLKGEGGDVFRNQKIKQFYDDLPAFFTTNDAMDVGNNLDISTASINRYLKKLTQSGLLAHLKHGEYTKVVTN